MCRFDHWHSFDAGGLGPGDEQQQQQELAAALAAAEATNDRLRGIIGALRQEMEQLQAASEWARLQRGGVCDSSMKLRVCSVLGWCVGKKQLVECRVAGRLASRVVLIMLCLLQYKLGRRG